MRDAGDDVVEVDAEAEEYWSGMVNTYASTAPFSEASYFFGCQHPRQADPLPAQPGWPSEAPFGDRPGDRRTDFDSFAFERGRESVTEGWAN